jgi:hypothetical protein
MSPATESAATNAAIPNPNHSTGPRTQKGKQRSALNALRHGLTGRTVVMPYEDMDAYHIFCKRLFQTLAPETPLEEQYAQTFCDTQWRLNRARSFEDAMIGLGHSEEAGEIETEHVQVHAVLTAARVFRDDSKSFVNLTLYEQRLHRTLDKTLRELKALQAERKAQRQAELDAAVAERNLIKMKAKHGRHHIQPESEPITRQFVFSTAEIEAEARRQFRLADAATAQRHHYDLENYRKFAPKWSM